MSWHVVCFGDVMLSQLRSLPALWSVVIFGTVAVSACGGTARVDGSTNSAGAAGQAASAGGGSRCETVDCSNVECRSDQIRIRRSGDCCDTCVAGDTAAVGGASSVGGASGVAGAFSGGGALGVAGAPSAGSGGALDCSGVSCALNCAPGELYETVPGSCCPQCRPQSPECLKGQAGYQQLFTSLLQQAGINSCVTDEDCTDLASFPACGDTCRSTIVNTTSAAAIDAELSQWAAANCSTCKAILLPCPAPPRPACVDGMCVSAPLR